MKEFLGPFFIHFKFFPLYLGLISCVPKETQVSCESNEKFNSAINTCVAVINEQTSELSISSYSPTSVLSYSKNSSQEIHFSVTVENPNNLTYEIKWERVFQGVSYPLEGNELTQSIRPSSYANQVGDHKILVRLISNDLTLASKTFSLNLTELPVPEINSSLTEPTRTNLRVSYNDDPVPFSITMMNNSSQIEDMGFETRWKLYRNNVLIYSETDAFLNENSTDSNSFYLGESSAPYFDPSNLGVGSYKITAEVFKSSQSLLILKKEWFVTVNAPPLSPIISRNILKTDTSKNFESVSNAIHDITFNNLLQSPGDFCVEVQDGEGSYSSDEDYVRVDFYLDDENAPVYSSSTSSLSNKVCLSDGDYSSIKFTNVDPEKSETHTLKAKVFDTARNLEYSSANMISGIGTYPIIWSFETHPQNTPPVASFPSELDFDCLTISPLVRNCTIDELQTFKLGFVGSDDFYDPSSDRNKFEYTIRFQRILPTPQNLLTCTKTSSDIFPQDYPNPDFTGPNFDCDLLSGIPSYDSNGPINPLTTLQVATVSFNDTGSPYSASPLSASSLTYNFYLNEVNTAPTINEAASFIALNSAPSTPITTAIERDEIIFSINTQDTERDHMTLTIYVCLTSACSTKRLIDEVYVDKTNDNLSETVASIPYTLPEDLVNKHLTNEVIYFYITLKDHPSTLSSLSAEPKTLTLNVTNFNPPPLFKDPPDPTPVSTPPYPYLAIFEDPIVLDAGEIEDASTVDSEKEVDYQWYIDSSGGDNNYKKIDGETAQTLSWRPPETASNDDEFNIKVCIHDGTYLNRLPGNTSVDITTEKTNPTTLNGPNCRGPWNFLAIAEYPNPGPYFYGTPIPDPVSTQGSEPEVMVGVPFYINAGIAKDASVVATQKEVGYQWYGSTFSTGGYKKINGAEKNFIYWTPPSNASHDQIFYLKLCVHDFTDTNPLPLLAGVAAAAESTDPNHEGVNCRGPWQFKAKSTFALLNNTNSTSASLQDDMAVWVDEGEIDSYPDMRIIYSAYADWNGNIYVDKIIYNEDGSINNSDLTGFKTVKFPAVSASVVPLSDKKIKDISLTGNNKYLLISYAFHHDGDGADYKIFVRRINKSYGTVDGINVGSKTNFPHPGKFGFNYDVSGLDIQSNPPPTSSITQDPDAMETYIYISRIYFPDNFEEQNLCEDNSFCFIFGANTFIPPGDSPVTTYSPPTSGDSISINEEEIFKCNFPVCPDSYDQLITDINHNSSRGIQGITARSSYHEEYHYAQTIIEGSFGYGDYHPYLDAEETTSKLGNIMIWDNFGTDFIVLPYLDDESSEIKFIFKLLDSNLNSDASIYLTSKFEGIENVKYFENKLFFDPDSNSAKIAILHVSDTFEEIEGESTLISENIAQFSLFDQMYRNNFLFPNTITLFNGEPVNPENWTSLRFSPPREESFTSGPTSYFAQNNHFFVTGKVFSSETSESRWKIGRYPNPLDQEGENIEYEFNFISSDKTKDILNSNLINSINIETFLPLPVSYTMDPPAASLSDEARLFVNSSYGIENYEGTTDKVDTSYLFAVNFSTNNTLTCGDCQPVLNYVYRLSKTANIALTPVQSYVGFNVGKQFFTTKNADFEAIFAVTPTRLTGDATEDDFNIPLLTILNMGKEYITTEFNNNLDTPPSSYRSSIIPYHD